MAVLDPPARPPADTARAPRASRAAGGRWLRRYYMAEFASYLRFLVSGGQSVLMFGCQDGALLAALQPSRGVGLETVGDAQARAVEGTFDVIVLPHVVDFMTDVQHELEQLRRWCHARTRVVLITHNYLWAPLLVWLERAGLKRAKGAYAWLTLNDLQNLLSFAGFEAVRREYRTLLPVRIPLLSWLINRVIGKLPGVWKLGVDQWVVARPLGLAPEGPFPSVSVIIPCRNERGTIEAIVERTPAMGRQTELVFVEGHSTDGTLEALRQVQRARRDRAIQVLVQEGAGKGDAVHQGMRAARGDLLIILDADLSVDPEALPRFVDALTSGSCELALGSRLVYPMPAQAMQPLNMMANILFGRAFSFLLGQQVKDTLCGTKALWKRDYQRIVDQRRELGYLDPFGDFEFILGAAKLSMKIREIPVQYRQRVYGTTNIRRWRHGLLLLLMVLRGLAKMKLQ